MSTSSPQERWRAPPEQARRSERSARWPLSGHGRRVFAGGFEEPGLRAPGRSPASAPLRGSAAMTGGTTSHPVTHGLASAALSELTRLVGAHSTSGMLAWVDHHQVTAMVLGFGGLFLLRVVVGGVIRAVIYRALRRRPVRRCPRCRGAVVPARRTLRPVSVVARDDAAPEGVGPVAGRRGRGGGHRPVDAGATGGGRRGAASDGVGRDVPSGGRSQARTWRR